jgi:outer membrane protein OmpA-like peptidoglycan-associated protein
MKTMIRRRTAVLVGALFAGSQGGLYAQGLSTAMEGASEAAMKQGRRADHSGSFQRAAPPSAERPLRLDGFSPSDVIRMRAAGELPLQSEPLQREQVSDAGGALFDSGEAVLKPAARTALDRVAQAWRGKPDVSIRVTGYTDNQRLSRETAARFGDNQGLSEARALAVVRYLSDALGIPVDQLAVRGRGEADPVADNATEAGRAQNRRVVIEITATVTKAVAKPQAAQQCGPQAAAAPGSALPPFRVTVDGKPIDADATNEADAQRCVDVALAQADIQIQYDPLQVTPALNAWVSPENVARGETVHFRSWNNYSAWIARAEIRVFAPAQSLDETPYAVVPLTDPTDTAWQPPADAPDAMRFVLRVYDSKGRFDETGAKTLRLLARVRGFADADTPERERLAGYGENSRVVRNIPVAGGTVTVHGTAIPKGHRVTALGADVPVDHKGAFVTRQIVATGPQQVSVSVVDPAGAGTTFVRNLVVPDNDWFYIAMGDLTVSRNSTSGPASIVAVENNDTYDRRTSVDGRGAFYLKGKIKGEYLLTAAADTREQPFSDLFSNFASKDPRYLLRRIDPDQYYPVYGDDSTIVDDAPTQGKFYVKLERGDSHVMWGNFQTTWTGTELTQYSRGLYGANMLWRSEDSTTVGERKSTLNVFAAEPGTIQSREEFRGTGGSLYYLRRQDVTQGSERLWIEVRDRDSGLVIERTPLQPGGDYDINYLQGRVTLRSPLSAVADGSGMLVRMGTLPGNPVYLVATYEYVPGVTDVDGMAYGTRGSHWFNDHLQVGVSGYRQGGGQSRQSLYGLDATLRYKPGTYVRVENARSTGAGSGTSSSIDGGFAFAGYASSGQPANAQRVEAAVDLADVVPDAKGRVSGYWQDREQGFSGPGQVGFGGEATRQEGVRADVPVGDDTRVIARADKRSAVSQDVSSAEGSVRHQVDDQWAVSVGARSDDRGTASSLVQSAILAQEGRRTDAVARVDYTPPASSVEGTDGTKPVEKAPWDAYGFAQTTVQRSGSRADNDRAGVGGTWQVSDRFRVGAEGSQGDGGFGGKLSGDWRVNDRSNVYLQYAMETEQPDLGWRGRFGSLTGGGRTRLTDTVSMFTEARYAHGTGPQSLTQAFGVEYAPTDKWTFGTRAEAGTVSDPFSGDIKRNTVGGSVAYKDDRLKATSMLEFRREKSNLSGERDSWLFRNTAGYQLTQAWRLLGKFNLAASSSSQGVFFDGDFTEAVLGAAYRPVDNDRWNALFKYTYFYNLPSPGQYSPGSGVVNPVIADYSQKSQVVSVDAIYDVMPVLSVGAKYGLRWGSLKPTKAAGEWFSSTAQLVVLRTDWHVVREWDAVLEFRRLWAREAQDARAGVLAAVYRHVGKNTKMGVGFNFTDYSDDLTDMSYRHRGWFFNVVSAF